MTPMLLHSNTTFYLIFCGKKTLNFVYHCRKAQWVRENGYGGVLIWEIDQDDVRGSCCATNRPLIRAVNYGLFNKGAAPSTYQCE